MVPKPPVQPRGTRHDRGLDPHHDRPHRYRRGEGRALAPDHLGFRGLRPLPEADRTADSCGHPRTPRVATRRLGTRSPHRRGLYCRVGVLQSAYEGVAAPFEQAQEEEGLGRVARGIVAAWPLGHNGRPATSPACLPPERCSWPVVTSRVWRYLFPSAAVCRRISLSMPIWVLAVARCWLSKVSAAPPIPMSFSSPRVWPGPRSESCPEKIARTSEGTIPFLHNLT